ncbi:hypothetical protein C0993_012595 [Termitomyces sp. T159_Od127]|nr:hypothetical protein C0993_012595 [Termitomyces sp. T159_Od127]
MPVFPTPAHPILPSHARVPMHALPRDAVAARILAGDVLVVCDGLLLRIPSAWLAAHPGGALAILHFVGRDATDEIHAFHSPATLARVARYAIARVPAPWPPLVPPVMSGWVRTRDQWASEATPVRDASQILLVEKRGGEQTLSRADLEPPVPPSPTSALSLDIQAQHSRAYKALHRRIIDAGLYNTPYLTGYGPELLRYLLLAALSALAYRSAWFLTSALCLGLLWHQLVFTVHDLGHRGVTHHWATDHILSILIADFVGGLSVGWWIQNHNIHHLVTNHPSHDPDIEHLPFLAISPAFLSSLWSSFYKRTMRFDRFAKTFVALQHNLFYLILLFGRFNLYVNSSVARSPRFPSHPAQIVLSHFSMSTADLGPAESFPHRQLRTTTDVVCHDALGFVHGGLQLQVTHHLIPRLPRHNLKRASVLVKEFAKEQGLAYAEFGFVDGNAEVIGVLRGVAQQVQLMGKVAKAEVEQRLAEKKVA